MPNVVKFPKHNTDLTAKKASKQFQDWIQSVADTFDALHKLVEAQDLRIKELEKLVRWKE